MKVRKTSKAAWDSIKDQRATMWGKIVKAAGKLPNGGNFEQIANKAGLRPDQVWRRLNELVEMKILVNTGETRPTSTGRKAMVRALNKAYAA